MGLENYYLLVVEKIVNHLLALTGSNIVIENHKIILNGQEISGLIPEIRFKKWMFIFLFLVWITKTPVIKRVLFTIILLFVHFLVITGYLTYGSYLSGFKNPDYSYLSIPATFGLLIIIATFFLWYRIHKVTILNFLSKVKINTRFLENDFKVFGVLCIFLIISSFLFDFFEFNLWIKFIFISSQKILALLGYNATVEPFCLVGSNGSIYMIKGCLGFQTMFLFAVLIFLTGKNTLISYIFMVFGIIFLNFVNIMRFVLLFIHLQRNGDYLLSMELHDMFTVVTYFIVFILWVIWFELFADSTKAFKNSDKIN